MGGCFKNKQSSHSVESSTALQIPGERRSSFPIWEYITSNIVCVEFKNHMAIVDRDKKHVENWLKFQYIFHN